MGKEYKLEEFKAMKMKLKSSLSLDIQIVSDSMYPILAVEERCTVSPYLGVDNLKRFDIIIFWQANRLICHYFWRTSIALNTGKLQFMTRSLKNIYTNDVPFNEDQILGLICDTKVKKLTQIKIMFLNMLRGSF